MSNREVMQQALEALENIDKAMPFPVGKQAITALREALEQPEQEPTCPECKAVVLYECVACSNNNYPPRPEQEPCIGKDPRCPCQDGDACHYKDCGNTKARPVPPAQPEQEPVASIYISQSGEREFDDWKCKLFIGRNLLYTTPPAAQRPWVGLTDEEIFRADPRIGTSDSNINPYQILINGRTIEAKLKEKNYG